MPPVGGGEVAAVPFRHRAHERRAVRGALEAHSGKGGRLESDQPGHHRRHDARVRRGDVVLEVDGKVAEGPRRFNELYERGKQSSLLLVYRGNGTIFVVVKKETEEENDDE